MTRRQFSLKLLFVLVTIFCVALAAKHFLWPSPPSIDPATAESLGRFADAWWDSHSAEDFYRVKPGDWPPEIRRLAPKSVRLHRDGIYIQLWSFFVLQRGLFVLPSRSKFQPTSRGDPSYWQLQGRVYWYKVEG